jgi:hypothetical protein
MDGPSGVDAGPHLYRQDCLRPDFLKADSSFESRTFLLAGGAGRGIPACRAGATSSYVLLAPRTGGETRRQDPRCSTQMTRQAGGNVGWFVA